MHVARALAAFVAGLVTLALGAGCGPASRDTPNGGAAPAASGGCPATLDAAAAPPGHPYLGVSLDWDRDAVDRYAERLGRVPAVYVTFAGFPLTAGGKDQLRAAASQVERVGGLLLVTLEPHDGLAAVTDAASADAASFLRELNDRGLGVILRFAHEMNGSWYPWSQDPAAYVEAFRRLAGAVEATAPATAMMWAPNYGGGYPFLGGHHGAAPGTTSAAALDTDGDGTLGPTDDPYAPYYPGDDVVDWVGMSLYHWGTAYPWGENEVSEPGKFEAMLTGTYRGGGGDETSVPDFYGIYAGRHGKSVGITETAALFNPAREGDPTAIKEAWWSQAFEPSVFARYPKLGMVSWFEWDKHEAEIGGRVDWTVTSDAELAARFSGAVPSAMTFAPGPCR
jgi:hypothetical protein